MNRLRSADLSVIVRVHHGVGFDLIEGSVTMEATFDGDLQQSGRTFPARRNRVTFDERFVWTVGKETVKSMRTANGVVLVQCFRIPSMPVDHGGSYELYERQRVGLAVIRLKEFQVIGRDWDQEVALRYYTLHCGTGNGNVALRMSLVIKDTSAHFNKPSAARPQDRYHRPRDRLLVVTPMDQQQPVATNRPQPVAAAATVRNRQPNRKTTSKREQYKEAKRPVAAYQSAKGQTYDDIANSMSVQDNADSMSVNDNSNSMHNRDKSHWMRLHECNYYPHDKIRLGASNATADDFIKTMEQLTVDMVEVRKKTSKQCQVVNEHANKTTWKDCPRIAGGRGDLDQLNPSERHRVGNNLAVTSRESLLTMTTDSVLSDDAPTRVRRVKKCNNIKTSMIRSVRINKNNAKTSGTAADQSCSSQSDNDMQRPVVLVEKLKESVNQLANSFYHMKKNKRYTKAKYSKGVTVLKKLNAETVKLNEKIREARLSACNQCRNEAL